MAFLSPAFRLISRNRSLFRNRRRIGSGRVFSATSNNTLTISSKQEVEKELAVLVEEISAYLARIYKNQKTSTLNRAKKICPVRTGNLRKSLEINELETAYYISGNVALAGNGFIGIILVDYNLFNLGIKSVLPYWPVINERYGIEQDAVELATDGVEKALPDLVKVGTGVFTRTYVRSK